MEPIIHYSPELKQAFHDMFGIAATRRSEFVTPEHLLLALLRQRPFLNALDACLADSHTIASPLEAYIDTLDYLPEGEEAPELSMQLGTMLQAAAETAVAGARTVMGVPHVVRNLMELPESVAAHALLSAIGDDKGFFMSRLVTSYPSGEGDTDAGDDIGYDDDFGMGDGFMSAGAEEGGDDAWESLVTLVNSQVDSHNPLIGREPELEATMRVLCRKDKNNVLHIGEPGVGKTALVYGLAKRINDGDVAEPLLGAEIYSLDLGTLIAGTQFRGDFEKRLKTVMDGVASREKPIVYIDEIHNLVGAGATGEGSLDASNMLKPYLEAGRIRFIGSTTFDEYKRHFAKSKGLVRRFTQVEVKEPTVDEAIRILSQLKPGYEAFHGVSYTEKAVDYAVRGSARHINDRFLPDKAIDLLDEAGAYRRMHPVDDGSLTVDAPLVAEVLAKVCKVDSLAVKDDDTERLDTLRERVAAGIFGQDSAVEQVTTAVQMAKAGLGEESEPLASMLFVGPTGVGKTEIARVLARELAVPLVRFDMSEFTERHAVAKLIGSPAGYVGYEDGGLLTDAIRKQPECVLLLDEIEKAHPDIYNILLQVMDYATLTDNKGTRADFRNVVLIMTSNAGARYASQAKVGFGNTTTSGEAMMRQVKKTFSPEFINRLTATVVFNDMTRGMASRILDRELARLGERLKARKVSLTLSDAARGRLLDEGFSAEYGARELKRVINSRLKPMLMREILFGRLKEGGDAEIDLAEGGLRLR